MAINYAKLFNRRVTPQSRSIPGSTQVANSAGGYSWKVDDWTRFDRFLIFGAEGGTYYIGERDLVKQNHDAILRCIKADGIRAVIRNLGKMTSIGLVKPFSNAAKLIVRKLGDETLLKRARVHPLAVLIAQKVYAQGTPTIFSAMRTPVPVRTSQAWLRRFNSAFGSRFLSGLQGVGTRPPYSDAAVS